MKQICVLDVNGTGEVVSFEETRHNPSSSFVEAKTGDELRVANDALHFRSGLGANHFRFRRFFKSQL